MRTASLGFLALMNSASASLNRPSSSSNMAYFPCISVSLSLAAFLAHSNASSNEL